MSVVSRSSKHALQRLSILSPVFSLTALVGLVGCGRDDKLAVYNAEPKAEITAPDEVGSKLVWRSAPWGDVLSLTCGTVVVNGPLAKRIGRV